MSIEKNIESIALSLHTMSLILAKMAGDQVSVPSPEPAAEEEKATAKKPTATSKTSSKASSTTKGAKAKKETVESESEPETSSEPALTLADVRKALGALQKKTDADTARGVLYNVGGASTLSQLKPDLFAAVIDAAVEGTK